MSTPSSPPSGTPPSTAPSSTPIVVPLTEGTAAPNEPLLTLRAKDQINVEGTIIKAGQTFQVPERLALGLVGTGDAEQIP